MRDGTLFYVAGASRSGKSAWTKEQTRTASPKDRLIIWDVKGEYPGRRITSRRELFEYIQRHHAGAIAYTSNNLADFDFWALAAFTWAKANAGRGKTIIIGDELSDVTRPGKAPQWWGVLLRRGLGFNCDIYAISQRPAESDTTAMGNAGVIHCARLNRFEDRRRMASEIDLPRAIIDNLRADEAAGKWDFVRVDKRTGQVFHGAMVRKGGKIIEKQHPPGRSKPRKTAE